MKHIFTNSNESAVVRNGYRCAKVARPLRTVFLIGTLLLSLGVGQMWAGPSFSGGYAYFYNKGGWSDNSKQLCIGRDKWGDDWTEVRTMTAIPNTKLWYNSLPTSGWGDATYMAVIGNSSAWGSNNWGSGNLTNANHRTGAVSLGDWGFGSGNVNMLTPASGNNDATLALSYVGNAYSSLNKTITIKAKVSTNNGSSYTETTTPAALDGASKVFTSYTSCAGTSGASATLSVGSSSTTFKAGYTATTTLTAPSTDPSGYKFAGWYDSDGSLVGATASSKTATVYPTADATYYAYYRKLYTISAGTTIVWDLAGNDANSGNSPWSSVYLYKDIEGSSASNDAFTQCGSSTQYAKNYASAVSNVKLFLFREVNTGTWNTYKQTTDIYSDVSGVTLFTYCNSTTYSDSKYKLDWQKTSPAYKAANGQTVYFDNTSTQWAQPKFKYGTQWFNRYVDMEQVPGTANLWKYTMPHDLYYGKYKIADEFGWTDYNNIDEDHCSHYTASQAASITSATTVIPSTNGAPCITSILNGYTRTVTISAPSNGTITVTYTDIDNSAQEQTSGSFNVAQTCIITVSASPNSGYVLSSLTVGGNAFTSGNTYTVWANTTISATFAAETTHNVDVSYICTDTEAAVKSGSTTAVGETTASTFEAGTPNGFSFTRWVVGDGLTITAGSTSTNSISVKTKASGTYTLRAEYTEVLTTSWYISGATGGGSPFSGSGTSGTSMSKKTGHSAEEIYYCTISVGTVATGSGFSFNPYNSSESKNYGNASANITKANNSADVYGDNSTALHFLPYVTGDYEFKLDNTGAHPVLTVTWPVYNQLRISAASPTDATNTGNYDLSDQGSNNWAVTRTLNAKTTYTFKMMYDSEWFGNSGNFTRASSSATNIGNTGNMTVRTDAAGDYTFTFNSSSYNFSITYPTAYTVTFGSDGHGTVTATATSAGGSMTSGDCVANNDVVTFAQTPNTGYSLKGWYTTVDGNTSAGLNGSNQLTINAAKTVYAQYNANNYTVTFNATANGGSCATASKSVTFDSPYGELPEATKAAQRFAGWFTTASGEGTQVTAETIVSTASDHILYARFEETYRVQVDYKCGSTTLRSSSEVHASATTVSAEISAPEILGYRFSGWTGSNVTFADASSATTTIHATTATTVTANYTAVPMVYFKNNLDWDDVYVSFNCGWATVGGKQVPTNNGKPYYKMEQLGNSDIFYCEIPSTYTASDYADWQGNIAFDNKGFGDGVSTHIGNSNSFWKGEFLGRGDFDPKATMFIPYNGATETRNEGTYYTRGCWIQYNSNYSGYKVRVNTYVQGGGGSEEANVELTASVAGATEFTAKVYLDDADYTYGLMLYKDYQKNSSNLWYTNVNDAAHTITSATTSLPWAFEPCDDSWQRCRVKTEAVGDYIVTVSFATGIPMVNIEYPVTVGDFRLKYTDAATWSNDAHDASWYHLSRVIKHANNAVDTVSFFVSYGSTPAIELQKCTNISDQGVETWTDQSTVSLTSITEAGVYNFKITQSANASSATVACIGEYSGNYYIRTDASDGGWSNYSDGVNDMTYSEYSLTHGGSTGRYSHYFMRHVNNGSNIKFCIANDYSMCISDTLVNDEYANEWIEREANVRFMWYSETNQISRAYISGSSIVSDRFLVLEGDAHLYNASGQALTTGNGRVAGLNEYEMNFIDDQNWVYEATVKADPKERIKLTAKFGTNVQYFYGKE